MRNNKVYQDNKKIIVDADLTRATVEQLLEQIKPLIVYDDKITVNLQKAGTCDSASLAFLVAVLREAKLKRSQIIFSQVPQKMIDLGRVSGIDGLITLE
tara:strand:+ start:21458 stop:21754 length:297 start_codon:yes stop_codon:yes gene_type:complete